VVTTLELYDRLGVAEKKKKRMELAFFRAQKKEKEGPKLVAIHPDCTDTVIILSSAQCR
jgi:hypothetical protein